MSENDVATGEDWSEEEVEATVRDYLAMLVAETEGVLYSKSGHRRALMARLRRGRTEAAVEFKHQNISAAMSDLGLPHIKGYRPRGNYQRAISDEIQAQLRSQPGSLDALIAGRPAGEPLSVTFAEPPQPSVARRAVLAADAPRSVDYVALQAENLRLGRLGEKLVTEVEKRRLTDLGRADLAARVRWVALLDGDGIGYDVFSYEADGSELHIEVKTTSLGATTPFYLSAAELYFAREHVDSYRLYRVYDVDEKPRVFVIGPPLDDALDLIPVTFRARLAGRTVAQAARGRDAGVDGGNRAGSTRSSPARARGGRR